MTPKQIPKPATPTKVFRSQLTGHSTRKLPPLTPDEIARNQAIVEKVLSMVFGDKEEKPFSLS